MRLERGGADLLLLCSNTMHKVAPVIQAATEIPFIHIADAVSEQVKAQGIDRLGLLGTRFTMEEAFYRDRLAEHGFEVLLPEPEDRVLVDRVIYQELCQGAIKPTSRREYVRIIQGLEARGAQGVVLGCTEIGLLVQASDSPVPVFDSARIHALQAVNQALADS